MYNIYNDIAIERNRQLAKWGDQNHPSVIRTHAYSDQCRQYGIPSERAAKLLCESAAKQGKVTWAHIALEEFAEALTASTEAKRKEELVQLAAVIVAWIDCIERKKAARLSRKLHKTPEVRP